MPDFSRIAERNIGLFLFAALISVLLLIGGLIDHENKQPFLRYFNLTLVADIGMLLGESGIWYFEQQPEHLNTLKLCTFLSFSGGYALIAFYGYTLLEFIRTKKNVSLMPSRLLGIFCLGAGFLTTLSIFNGFLFYFDAQAVLRYTRHYWIVVFMDIAAAIALIILVIHYRKTLGVRNAVVLSCVSALPMACMSLQAVWDSAPSYLMISFSMILIFIVFHAELSRQLIQKEKELLQSQIAVMLSQIQPHFLYNVLASIHYLCDKNPQSAKKAIEEFSSYLRGNMNALQQNALIPFEEELHHVETYLKLEKMRFDDDLQFAFRITVKDFFLPALTVQPIVENAVKHGVGTKENGGTITISTSESESHYLITIADDGVGFDIRNTASNIGIENVRKRLLAMCEGALHFESKLGQGTIATIHIPKEASS